MLNGLAITPPILGRISIGKTIEKNGKRLPQKDDQFTITSQIQTKDGWKAHPIDEQLRQSLPEKSNKTSKLRKIPVRMLFNDPELNLRAEYTLFDRQTGRQVCVGNGITCRRRSDNGIEEHPCPSPDSCALANNHCKPYGRLYVSIHHPEIDNDSKVTPTDELGAFVLRTTGFNSIRTLTARLSYYQALSGNLLAYLPLQLILRGKSSLQSYKQPVYYVDVTLQEGISLTDAIKQAQQIKKIQLDTGIDQDALEQVARKGFEKSAFEISSDEANEVVAEFYAESSADNTQTDITMLPMQLQQALHESVQVVN